MTMARHAWYMTVRDMRALWRQPWFVAITLLQPVIWLLLFGALFKSVAQIPGFGSASYIDFLTPGIVMMTALFSAGWSGMSTIQELERGTLDRLLTSPLKRVSFIAGRVLQSTAVVAIQSVIILAIAYAAGARFSLGGAAVLLVFAGLLGAAFTAFSNGIALLARNEQTLIGAVNFLILPLTFLSAAFMQKSLMPVWIQHVADYNPVSWATESARQLLTGVIDWGFVALRGGLLVALLAICAVFATRAFRSYQRSI